MDNAAFAQEFEALVEAEMIITAAGGFAEQVFTGRYSYVGCESDRDLLMDLARWISHDREDALRRINHAMEVAYYRVHDPEFQACIKAVAEALVERKTLQTDDVEDLVGEALARYHGRQATA